MCRFALVKSKKPVSPEKILSQFSKMAQKSKALDGDWQGDGWGIAWANEDTKWQSYKSLLPVWKDTKKFSTFPKTNMFLIHARSASFPSDRGIIEYNQPYVFGAHSFVFNGLLKGVQLSAKGRIGAEKIWFLLRSYLNINSPAISLQKTAQLLLKNTREVMALNIGLSDLDRFYIYNYFSKSPEYYQLQLSQTNNLTLVCSEKIGDYEFKPLAVGDVVTLS